MPGFICFVGIGLLAGILSGFFGIGGGIIIVPALIYICGFNQLLAQGTSLAIMLPPVGLLAFLEYYKKGNVNLSAGIIICITLFLGALFGAKIAHLVSPLILKRAFAILLILVSLKMLFAK